MLDVLWMSDASCSGKEETGSGEEILTGRDETVGKRCMTFLHFFFSISYKLRSSLPIRQMKSKPVWKPCIAASTFYEAGFR